MLFVRAHLWEFTLGAAALILGIIVLAAIALLPWHGLCKPTNGYLAPGAGCAPPPIDKSSYNDLRNSIVAYISDEKKAGEAIAVSVYFRDLNDGPTFGISQYAPFIPASLLKLPLAMAYMRLSESNPGLLSTSIQFNQDVPLLSQYYKPPLSAKKDTPYLVSDLLRYMLAYSDNASYGALFDYLKQVPDGPSSLYRMYQNLGIDTNLLENTNGSDVTQDVDPQTYGSIFRGLYYGSYLDAASSEQIIKWLLQSDFQNGLQAKIPSDIPVADKFGERSSADGSKELHDCGIVYYPKNPYVLCIMTQGTNWSDLSSIIETISKQIYDEVNSRAQ